MRRFSVLAAVPLFIATACCAALYNDDSNDIVNAVNNPQMDIRSVAVSQQGSSLTFDINVGGTVINGGRYYLGIDSKSGGDTTGNPWAGDIRMSSGMDYFVAVGYYSYSREHQADLYNWTGSAWSPVSKSSGSLAMVPNSSSYRLTFTDTAFLGLANGGSLNFDVYSSGGYGNPAVDALSTKTTIEEGAAYDTGLNYMTFEVTAVPEPAHYGLMCAVGLFGVAMLRSRRKAAV